MAIRFPIAFDSSYAHISKGIFIRPSDSYIEISGTLVTVRMGWAFHAEFDRGSIAKSYPLEKRIPLTRGVHGWAGRWLVNGAGDNIVVLEFEPTQRGYVMRIPVRLSELKVSVDDTEAVRNALKA